MGHLALHGCGTLRGSFKLPAKSPPAVRALVGSHLLRDYPILIPAILYRCQKEVAQDFIAASRSFLGKKLRHLVPLLEPPDFRRQFSAFRALRFSLHK